MGKDGSSMYIFPDPATLIRNSLRAVIRKRKNINVK